MCMLSLHFVAALLLITTLLEIRLEIRLLDYHYATTRAFCVWSGIPLPPKYSLDSVTFVTHSATTLSILL